MVVRSTRSDVPVEIVVDNQAQLEAAVSAIACFQRKPAAHIPLHDENPASIPESRINKRGSAIRFNSGGMPHPECVEMAMTSLGVPASVQDVLAELRTNPEIDYKSKADRPEHGIKQILKNNPEKYVEVSKGIWMLKDPSHIDKSTLQGLSL